MKQLFQKGLQVYDLSFMVPPNLQNLNQNMQARQSGQALASRKLLPQKVSMHLSAQIDQTMILQPSGDKSESGKPWQNQIRWAMA